MENNNIQKLKAYAEKPMTGFSVSFEKNELVITVKPKTALFGCLTTFIVALSIFLFFYIDSKPGKYLFTTAPVAIGFIGLVKLSKNATQTTFNFSEKEMVHENVNFIGKLFNKPQRHIFSEIIDIIAREEKIKNTSSSNNTTSYNYVYKIYLIINHDELQVFTVNKGVLNFSEVEDFANILKQTLA